LTSLTTVLELLQEDTAWLPRNQAPVSP